MMTAIFISFVPIMFVNILASVWEFRNQSEHITYIDYSAWLTVVAVFFFMSYVNIESVRIILV